METTQRHLPELKRGESPFDHLSRDELVRFAQRSYAAVTSARGALVLLQHGDTSGYWSAQGAGGKATALCDAIVNQVGYDADMGSSESENLWRAFYRPYQPLLFPDAVARDGAPVFERRYICDACGEWTTTRRDFDPLLHRFLHAEAACNGVPRPMTADDLPPVPTS